MSRQIDALIAEKVMGRNSNLCEVHGSLLCGPCTTTNYSSDISAALEVVDVMARRGWTMRLDNIGLEKTPWNCTFTKVNPYPVDNTEGKCGCSESAAKAICLAALRACGIEVPNE